MGKIYGAKIKIADLDEGTVIREARKNIDWVIVRKDGNSLTLGRISNKYKPPKKINCAHGYLLGFVYS